MGTSLNQGKCSNATKNSLSLSKSQNPCAETLVTSASKVCLPSFSDFIFVFPDEPECCRDLTITQAIILREFDVRFKPKLRFPIGPMDVHMHPSFFARKEVKPESSAPEDGRAHVRPQMTTTSTILLPQLLT